MPNKKAEGKPGNVQDYIKKLEACGLKVTLDTAPGATLIFYGVRPRTEPEEDDAESSIPQPNRKPN
jgi:hypothetical protein